MAQHRVRHETQQLLQIPRPTLDQVFECLGDDATVNCRGRHALGVGHRLASEREQWDPARLAATDELVKPVPRAAPSKQPHDDSLDSAEIGDPRSEYGRVGRPNRRKAVWERLGYNAEPEYLGVGVSKDEDHAGVSTVEVMSEAMRSRSRYSSTAFARRSIWASRR